MGVIRRFRDKLIVLHGVEPCFGERHRDNQSFDGISEDPRRNPGQIVQVRQCFRTDQAVIDEPLAKRQHFRDFFLIGGAPTKVSHQFEHF